ncbi:MAG: hypothetical protein FWG65_13310 [Turicibacter sp.]|nr:hypothetical protein [Turicibacter sp.]
MDNKNDYSHLLASSVRVRPRLSEMVKPNLLNDISKTTNLLSQWEQETLVTQEIARKNGVCLGTPGMGKGFYTGRNDKK